MADDQKEKLALAFADNEKNKSIDALFIVVQHDHFRWAQALRHVKDVCKATRAEKGLWVAVSRATYGRYKKTLLMYEAHCGNLTRVKWLLDRGAEVAARDHFRSTAMVYAVSKGATDVVEALLAAADFRGIDETEQNMPLLATASSKGFIDIVHILLAAGAVVDALAQNGWTSLSFAARGGHIDVARALIAAGASADRPLFIASTYGHTEIALELIAAGAGVNIAMEHGMTPLSMACQSGHTEIVVALLAAGANVDVMDEKRETPLLCACKSGHVEAVHALIAAGADVNVGMRNDRGPLFFASESGHMEIVRALLDAGAMVDGVAVSRKTPTPLFVACQNGFFDVVSALIAAGAGVNITRHDGATPLRAACKLADSDIALALIAAGAGVDSPSKDGTRPLYSAASRGFIDNVRILLRAGARINAATNGKYNRTALHVACLHGQLDVVRCLLEAGASLTSVDDRGDSALSAALRERYPEIVECLRETGDHWTAPMVLDTRWPARRSARSLSASLMSTRYAIATFRAKVLRSGGNRLAAMALTRALGHLNDDDDDHTDNRGGDY